MLAIRLRRIGKRQHATFRFVVSEKTRSPLSRVVEFLGFYDPHTDPPTINLKRERISFWLEHGAQPSETVHNMLVGAGLLPGPKVRVGRPKQKKIEETPATAPAASAAPVEAAETENIKPEAKSTPAEVKG